MPDSAPSVVSNDDYIQEIVNALVSIGALQEGQAIKGKDIAALVRTLKLGVNTSDATAVQSDVISGATFYAKGNKLTGTMPALSDNNLEVTVTDAGLIHTVAANYKRYPMYMPADNGIAKQVQLNVNSGGVITPTKTQTTLALKGDFMTNGLVIRGDNNLIPNNIKSGVSIFNVTGTYNGGANETYNDTAALTLMSSSSNTVSLRVTHGSNLTFTPRSCYLYYSASIMPNTGGILVGAYANAAGRLVTVQIGQNYYVTNVGSTCSWTGNANSGGTLFTFSLNNTIGYGGTYIVAIGG